MKDRGSNPRWRVFYFFPFLPTRLHRHPLSPFLFVWGCSSDGRAFALHARGTGIDTPHLHYSSFYSFPISFLLHTTLSILFSLKNDNGRIRTYAPDGNCLAGSRLDRSATLSYITIFFPNCPSYPFLFLYFLVPNLSFIFSKKRQWQDLNLRIQRIIDFKSIALDHSATLSIHSFLSSASPFLSLSLLSIPFLYLLFFFLSYLLSYLASYSTFFPFYFCNLQ